MVEQVESQWNDICLDIYRIKIVITLLVDFLDNNGVKNKIAYKKRHLHIEKLARRNRIQQKACGKLQISLLF